MPVFVQVSLVISTLILITIFYGVSQRKNRRRHVPIMVGCGIADILLVVAIIGMRRALPQAMEADTAILRIHLAFSIPALLLWFSAFYSGFMRKKGKCVGFHKFNAIAFLVARTGNWVTSFFVY